MEQVIQRIHQQYAKLTASEQRIAQWLEKSQSKLAFQTVSQLARDTGVSEATIVRFARKLGYESYPAMQREVQQALQQQYSLGDKLHKSLGGNNQEGFLAKRYRTEIQNLEATYEQLDEVQFSDCVESLAAARRVAFVGFRASFGVAAYMNFAFNLIRPDVTQIRLGFDNVHDQLLDFCPKDILVAFSLSRPARKTLEVVREAKECYGMKVLAITDSRLSPIGELSDLVMVASTQGTFNSYTAVMSLCHTLLEAVAKKLQSSAEARLRRLDKINQEDVFYKGF